MNILVFVSLFALAGAGFGVLAARRRGGNRLDMAQYAGSFAIFFALLAMLLGILIMRQMV